MKPLLVLARITLVGCLWSIIFIEGVRVIMLENWHFDIFWPPHWLHAWNLWLNGWVIDTPKEWAFVLILITFLPLWLTGWIALSMIAWEKIIAKIIMAPINLIRHWLNPLKIVSNKTPVVIKKKSYKEIRPTGPRAPIYDYNDSTPSPAVQPAYIKPAPTATATSTTYQAPSASLKKRATDTRETFNHSLFNFDDDEDDFELDFDSFDKSDIFAEKDNKKNKKAKIDKYTEENETFEYKGNIDDISFDDDEEKDTPKPPKRNNDKQKNNKDNQNRRENRNGERNNRDNNKNRVEHRKSEDKTTYNTSAETEFKMPGGGPVADVLSQKGYDILSGITIRNTVIDFIGISEDKICVCLIDKEQGDWLADEERFNNEEPLWFSENSHRISPVRKLDIACEMIKNKLESNDFELEIKPYVVIQSGNIINAEDMFEVWADLGIEVTRINRGSPKEIKLFSKSLPEAENSMDKKQFSTLTKLLKNLK